MASQVIALTRTPNSGSQGDLDMEVEFASRKRNHNEIDDSASSTQNDGFITQLSRRKTRLLRRNSSSKPSSDPTNFQKPTVPSTSSLAVTVDRLIKLKLLDAESGVLPDSEDGSSGSGSSRSVDENESLASRLDGSFKKKSKKEKKKSGIPVAVSPSSRILTTYNMLGIKIKVWNCNSLSNKKDNLFMLSQGFDIIACCESRLDPKKSYLNFLSGYNFIRKDRISSSSHPGGGLVIFIKKCFNFRTIDLNNLFSDDLECLSLEIDCDNNITI